MDKRLIACALTLASLGVAPAANADQKAVQQAEEQLKAFEKRSGPNHAHYGAELYSMATVYQRNGERKKADAMFRRVMELERKRGYNYLVGTMNSWATDFLIPQFNDSLPRGSSREETEQFMLREKEAHKQDLKRAIEVLKEAKGYASQVAINDRNRYAPSLSLITYLDKAGGEAEEKALLNQIHKDSTAAGTAEARRNLAMTLDTLADRHRVKPGELQTAIRLKEEALVQWNKLPKKDAFRLRALRQSVSWFQLVKREDLAEKQTRVLSALLGTTDRDKLFPPIRECLACGRG